MSAEVIINEIGDQQGWNDQSKVLLLCQYIDNQQQNDALEDFLRQAADDENSECLDEVVS